MIETKFITYKCLRMKLGHDGGLAGAPFRQSGDKPHVGIAGVTLHKTRPISIIEDTNRWSFSLSAEEAGRSSHTFQEAGAYRGTSLIRNRPPPRTTKGPWSYSYCRVLGGRGCLWARYPCTRFRRNRPPSHQGSIQPEIAQYPKST